MTPRRERFDALIQEFKPHPTCLEELAEGEEPGRFIVISRHADGSCWFDEFQDRAQLFAAEVEGFEQWAPWAIVDLDTGEREAVALQVAWHYFPTGVAL